MSEQAPLGDLGGVQPRYPYSSEYIAVVLEEEGSLVVELGSVHTGSEDDYETWKQCMSDLVDGLLAMYSIEAMAWKQQAVGLRFSHQKDVSGTRLRITPDTRTAGVRLHDAVFGDMPMELENDGDGEATLVLQLGSEHQVELIGEGIYWRERFYKHPVTGKTVCEKADHEEWQRLWEEHGELEYIDYEDGHSITFKARITRLSDAEQPTA